MKKKFGKAASNGYMQLSTSMFMKQKNVVTKTTGKVLNANSTSMFMKQKNVGLANYRVSFKCNNNKYVYEATNILFTFENRGGALKQN